VLADCLASTVSVEWPLLEGKRNRNRAAFPGVQPPRPIVLQLLASEFLIGHIDQALSPDARTMGSSQGIG